MRASRWDRFTIEIAVAQFEGTKNSALMEPLFLFATTKAALLAKPPADGYPGIYEVRELQ
jgi:hypothetical protein